MVLMPCGKCCDKCACQSCICCECDGTIPGDTAATPTARWARFMSGKLSSSAHDDLEADFPCASLTAYERFATSDSYDRLVALLPDCQISRRWDSQSECVDALIASEVAAIIAAGEPYTYDPWYGWCRIPTKVGDSITIDATFGSGAKAEISKQDDCTISEITVTDGGSGYARLGRIAPTLTISGGSGAGATFTPTLSSSGSPTVWALASATASGGSGYVDGESLTITAAIGDTTVTKAAATVTARSQPSITATAGGSGTGATLSVSVAETGKTPKTWNISAISVTAGGTGYKAGDPVTLGYSSDVVVSGSTSASVVVSDERTEPEFSVDASGAGGTGATFSFSYAYDSLYNDYELTAITVTNGGSGYSTGGTVVLNKSADTTATGNTLEWSDAEGQFPGPIILEYTVSGGAIASVSGWGVPLDGLYGWRLAGVIESVNYGQQTEYHNKIGAASAVTVTNGGQYYREDASAPPEVATLTIYDKRGAGAAAEYQGTIDEDTGSPTFGEVLSVTRDWTGFGGGELLPTPTSSLTPEERQSMLTMFCPHSLPTPPTGFDGFWEPLTSHEPVTFADAAEVEEKIAELYGAGGPMDAAKLYAGYCSARTLLKSDGTKYMLGWSTPYRKGSPLTPAVVAALCAGGLPWKYQPDEEYPAVFTSWGTAIFSNDDIPPVRSITLKASTGDAVVDDFIEAGTKGVDPVTNYAKTVTFSDRDNCDDRYTGDVTIGNTLTSGEKSITIEITKSAGGTPVQTWYVGVTFRPCSPRDDIPPTGSAGPYISDYVIRRLDHATSTLTDVTNDLIENSLSFRPYESQGDCESQNFRTDALCAGTLWQFYGVGDEESLKFTCCWGYAADTEFPDAE